MFYLLLCKIKSLSICSCVLSVNINEKHVKIKMQKNDENHCILHLDASIFEIGYDDEYIYYMVDNVNIKMSAVLNLRVNMSFIIICLLS